MTKDYLFQGIKLLDRQVVSIRGEGRDELTRLLLLELAEAAEEVPVRVLMLDGENEFSDLDDYPLLIAPVIQRRTEAIRALSFILGPNSRYKRSHRTVIFMRDFESYRYSDFLQKLSGQNVTLVMTSEWSEGHFYPENTEARIHLKEKLHLQICMDGDIMNWEYPKFDAYLLSRICNMDLSEPTYDKYLIRSLFKDEEIEVARVVDEKFDEAVACVRTHRIASASFLQRRLGIGYNRAANLIQLLEDKKIISPAKGSIPRKVLITAVSGPCEEET